MILQEMFRPVSAIPKYTDEQKKAMDAAREDDDFVLPELQKPEAGFFDGICEAAWKGPVAGALKTASAFDTMLSSTGMARSALQHYQNETGDFFDDLDKRQVEVENQLDKDARQVRAMAKKDYGVNPETMGTAAQIVYGIGETIPKAIGYSLLGGQAGGALMFGADLGVNRAQELMDEGVDKETAINAGLVTFGTAAFGMRLPATFGKSRIASATIGAAANVGLSVAELQGVNWVLQSQNYKELSKKYELNFVDLATSAIFGGVMGAAFFRPGMTPKQTTQVQIRDDFSKQLKEAHPEFSDEQINAQAEIHAVGVMAMAERAGVDASEIAPTIVGGEISQGGFDQIIGERGVRSMDQADENWTRSNNLKIASEMETSGKGVSEIRIATGWERGADGKWRYEIPDIEFKEDAFNIIKENNNLRDEEINQLYAREGLTDDEYINGEQAIVDRYERQTLATTLDQIVDAPELFKAYPELRRLRVEFGPLPKNVFGFFAQDDNGKFIRIGRDSNIFKKPSIESLAHEIQHAIQEIEGFTGGSSVGHFLNEFDKGLSQEIVKGRNNIYRLEKAYKSLPEYSEYQKILDDGKTGMEYLNSGDMDAYYREQERLEAKYGEPYFMVKNKYGEKLFKTEEYRAYDSASQDFYKRFNAIHKNFDSKEFLEQYRLKYAIEKYRQVSGEVESRNVEKRLWLSENARQQRLLRETEDIPRSLQDVGRVSGEAYSMADLSETMKTAVTKVVRIIDRVLNGKSTNGNGKDSFEDYLPVSDRLEKDAKALGLDIAGYKHTILDGDVNHAFSRHGVGNERDQSQIPITKEDLSRLPLVVEEYDKVELGDASRRNQQPTVLYTKTFPDGVQIVVEEVRKGRKKLAFKTAYKKIPSGPDVSNQVAPQALRPERAEAASSLNDSISQNEGSVNDFSPDEGLIERAKAVFGTTNDVREAFYILPDGTMLDGSGRHWGGSEIDVAGQRMVDHADIAEVIDDSKGGADAMYKWMARSGAMRFDQIVGIASIARKPTAKQLAVLNRASRGKYLALSRNTPEGRIVDDIEFDSATPSKIRNFFEDAQIKADNGVAGAFAQKAMDQNQVRGSFNPALNEIKLTPNADMSTFSHEMGHWYLTNLFELSGKKGVDSTLVEDVNTLLKEFGVNSVDDWNALGIEGQRKAQEQFASWVEIYLSSGKAPKPSLTRLFERMAQWIVDVYRELGGTKKAVSDRFEGEFQTKLPETSPEVQKVLDRLFAKDREIRKARKVDAEQVAAARMVQSERTNKDRLKEIVAMPEGVSKTKVLQDQEKALTAQLKAVRDMLDGRPVDVSKELKDVNINEQAINQGKHDFGRQVLVGDNQRAVILQNRDRATDASINQMLSIAGNPQYGMVSVSRGYNGAPIVSFGQLPEQRFMGNQDFITENNGNEIPFQYAVVEADSVETSNSILGDKNPNYGNPDLVSAVIGNGRMTALKEAYVRNTAGTYRQKLTADTQHGVDPAVIAEMKNPILVRFISPDDVTTGLISRSNADQVLARNDVEVAFEDAPKIRANIKNYEFDENGEPTRDTLLQFAQDIDDVNAQGHLISGGEPSKEAIRRLRNAVFYEAYQTPALSQMYSIETDTGIARILNALSALAPKVVRLRETAKSLDFSSELVNAVNEIIKARTESADGKVILGQGGLFGGDVSEPFIQLLSENSNSAKAILRVLSPLADWAESASQIKEGGLFGDDIVPSADIGDLMVQMRNIQNELRAEKGLEALPEIDVEAVRASAAQLMNDAAEGLENINTALNEIDAQVAPKVDDVEAPEPDLRGLSRSVLDENTSEAARAELQNFDDPDQVFKFIDDDGNEMSGTLQELLEQGQKAVDDAEIEADAYGRATECILRNGGI